MAIKKFWLFLLFTLSGFFPLFSQAQIPLGQTLQINTHFNHIYGEPVWLLVLRDVQTGQVLPYIFDLKKMITFGSLFQPVEVIASLLQILNLDLLLKLVTFVS